jgi:hypothetical protein
MRRIGDMVLAFAFIGAACASPRHWPARPAEHPATRAELASYELTVRGPPQFAAAMAEQGFHVVDHPPYNRQLEVTLEREGNALVATLRSDGWFVDEALAANIYDAASTLAVSARVAEFIRNSGLPQQHPTLSH